MVQPSLLVKSETPQVILPVTDKQVQVVRDTSVFGLGKYWAYFKDGNRELIGGPGAPPSVGFDAGLATRTAVEGSGVQIIATQGRPKLIFLSAFDSINIELFSKGIVHDSLSLLQNVQSWSDPATTSNRGDVGSQISIYIATNGDVDGMQAKVSAITNNGFELTWIKLGAGRDVEFQWHVITA